MKRMPVAVIVGTRPEAVKLAPVIRAMEGSKILRPVLVATSQHGAIVRGIFRNFDLQVAHDLHVMRAGQTLWDLSSRLLARLGRFFAGHKVAAVLVQGDTTSALCGAMAAFYHHLPTGHVEAGLRTGNVAAPFPEEMNRTLLTRLVSWHFAPTTLAADRLRGEGIPTSMVFHTGNPVVDALRWMMSRCRLKESALAKLIGRNNLDRPLILVTCHRRESLGQAMRSVARGLARVAQSQPEAVILFPLHPNPAVRQAMLPRLSRLPNVILCGPLDYLQFVACLQHARFVLSDSGGIQEEATALGKPLLVLRHETERPEGLSTGVVKLVGTEAGRILRECDRLLTDQRVYARMCQASDVFGDGRAGPRIVRILEKQLRQARRSRKCTPE
jgi:UDP-N-acetylglucosamine 2-epimerase (non-hydrolysing)